ncbi:hypothetical protein [Vibrio neonatus]|uniref:hypothetical protein n=1 Tax=Vibrio neonatus TaxID=278860 RepID=UPI0021C3FF50|nr:hypothetical protein [Vibrio neonatus]
MKTILYLLFTTLFVGCADNSSYMTQSDFDMRFDDDFQTSNVVKSSDDIYDAYFFDTKNSKFYFESSKSKSSFDLLLSDTIQIALNKANEIDGRLNVTLYYTGSISLKSQIFNDAKAYFANSSDFNLQDSSLETKKIINRINARELDPFYVKSKNSFSEPVSTSDLIVFLSGTEERNRDKIRVSILNNKGVVLATKTHFEHNTDKGNLFIDVSVKYTDRPGFKKFKLKLFPVSQRSFSGIGSNNLSVTNVSFEQANEYCLRNNMQLSSPYIFENARKQKLIKKPNRGVTLEMISPLDSDDVDEPFLREGDYLELVDDYQSNYMLVFDWTTETYRIVFNSFKSSRLTFRCYKD